MKSWTERVHAALRRCLPMTVVLATATVARSRGGCR